MNNRHLTIFGKIIVILLFIALLFGLRSAWFAVFRTAGPVTVTDGTADLRGLDWSGSRLIKLDGEWSFYPSRMLTRDGLAGLEDTHVPLQVPGSWSPALENEHSGAYGYGTYRLRILTDPLEEPVSLWIKQIQSASAVEINGTPAGSAGSAAPDRESGYVPETVSYTAVYYAEGVTEMEVLIQAANYDHPYKGGIRQTVFFGTEEAVGRTVFFTAGFQSLTAVILLLHGLYAFILYLFNPKERALFLVGLMTLSVAVILLARNDNFPLTLLSIPYGWSFKIRLIAFMWQNLLILLVFRKFVTRAGITKGLRLFIGAVALYCILIMVLPAPAVIATFHWGIAYALQAVPSVWFLYTLGCLLFKPKVGPDAVFLLFSGAAIVSNLLWSSSGISESIAPVYYPLDILAAIVGFSAYWFKQYLRNAKENNKLNEELKQADQIKDQFLANTSHELRTPLHGMISIAQNVLDEEGPRLGDESRKDLGLMITIGRRMSHMLGDLLDIVRLQEHRIVLKKEPVSIQATVSGVTGMLNYMIEGKPVTLKTDIAEKLPPVLADEKRLVQILVNLVHNALKYTEQGEVTVSAALKNGRMTIAVSDTGPGMSEETLSKAFLPYEQGPHGLNDGRGVGLGLSICRQLTELHGSALTVSSEMGTGSVLSFELPLARLSGSDLLLKRPDAPAAAAQSGEALGLWDIYGQAADGPPAAAPESMPPLLAETRIDILAVDDDPVNLNVLAGMLAGEAYAVVKANSGQEALELLDTRPWDLVIADVMMPQMSGYELTKRIRERRPISELPVLLLTARTTAADIYAGFAAGANDYVAKPVDATELRYRIRALTAVKRSYNERLRIEAAYLQAQIHPHFLFNTFNSILALGDLDTVKMQGLVEAMASFLRLSYDFHNTDELVNLSHELELLKAYLYVEETRFAERLSVVWKLEPGLDVRIPPLSLQPLVENAVKHSLLDARRKATVEISVWRDGESVRFEVQDNGPGIGHTEIQRLLDSTLSGKAGIGLSNTHRRLKQLYGQGLAIDSLPGEGTTVSFAVPCSVE